MKKILVLVLLAFASQISLAQERPAWFKSAIKSPTPNELSYYLVASKNCPFDLEKAQTVVDGVLIRSRIKPLREDIFVDNRVYLNMTISCLVLKSNNPVFDVEVNFARISPYPSIIFDQHFGTSGIGDSDYILQAFKESVESAVTEHIKANFDL
jgi:hypothetical protein